MRRVGGVPFNACVKPTCHEDSKTSWIKTSWIKASWIKTSWIGDSQPPNAASGQSVTLRHGP